MPGELTEAQRSFLDAYRVFGMVKAAAEQAGVSRELHYNALRTSESYRHAFQIAQRDSALALEEEARNRAIDGYDEPVFQRGKIVGFRRRYSDRLLIFLLEANVPEKFGRHATPRNAPEQQQITVYLPDNGRHLTNPPDSVSGQIGSPLLS